MSVSITTGIDRQTNRIRIDAHNDRNGKTFKIMLPKEEAKLLSEQIEFLLCRMEDDAHGNESDQILTEGDNQ